MKKSIGVSKKFATIVVILVVASAVGVILIRSNQSTKKQTIASSDGVLQLTLAPNALPKGVAMNSLGITKTSAPDDTDVLVYALAPDGMVLREPAQIAISFPVTDADTSIPLLVHRSDTQLYPLDDVVIVQNETEKKITATTKISHFSSITILRDMLRVSVQVPNAVYVQEPFTTTGLVEILPKPNTVLQDGTQVFYTIAESLMIEGQMVVNKTSSEFIQPQGRENTPAYTKVQGRNKISAPAEFTCFAPTDFVFFDYSVNLSGELKATFVYSPQEAKRLGTEGFTDATPFKQTVSVISRDFNCMAKTKPTPVTAPSNTVDTGKNNANLTPLDVLLLDGKLFPANQFQQSGSDTGCDASHYHAQYEVSDINLETHRTDPNPSACGFGTVDSVPRKTEMVSRETAELFKY